MSLLVDHVTREIRDCSIFFYLLSTSTISTFHLFVNFSFIVFKVHLLYPLFYLQDLLYLLCGKFIPLYLVLQKAILFLFSLRAFPSKNSSDNNKIMLTGTTYCYENKPPDKHIHQLHLSQEPGTNYSSGPFCQSTTSPVRLKRILEIV